MTPLHDNDNRSVLSSFFNPLAFINEPECVYCTFKFTFFDGRHHCRICRLAVCARCSAYELDSHSPHGQFVRKCVQCARGPIVDSDRISTKKQRFEKSTPLPRSGDNSPVASQPFNVYSPSFSCKGDITQSSATPSSNGAGTWHDSPDTPVAPPKGYCTSTSLSAAKCMFPDLSPYENGQDEGEGLFSDKGVSDPEEDGDDDNLTEEERSKMVLEYIYSLQGEIEVSIALLSCMRVNSTQFYIHYCIYITTCSCFISVYLFFVMFGG